MSDENRPGSSQGSARRWEKNDTSINKPVGKSSDTWEYKRFQVLAAKQRADSSSLSQEGTQEHQRLTSFSEERINAILPPPRSAPTTDSTVSQAEQGAAFLYSCISHMGGDTASNLVKKLKRHFSTDNST
ncbi:hypothetical protein I302_100306 [Kwoniella bestiolae CBS 10118]|uniref:Uncharacterized protein n=1 Tax=Kwoniella bestiolae CBS 10118 TaxID=1296100 RepID=A0A1B9G4R6_9TREE|nr:hypothetical protein I302_03678 [Kwoniella bestiolae CBS 10118]OCF26001.1 hypothetical protein I302_03678 [Kwoniella bestiolae CBS 10118]